MSAEHRTLTAAQSLAQPYRWPASGQVPVAWSGLALFALFLGNVMAIVLVMSRTPFVQDLLPDWNLFPYALVYHVDFSIVVWALCSAALVWQQERCLYRRTKPLMGGFLLALVGVLSLLVTPLLVTAPAVLNSYVPILFSPLYLAGFVILAAGVLLLSVSVPLLQRLVLRPKNCLELSAVCFSLALWFFLVSVGVFFLTAWRLDKVQDIHAYAEQLFWGGGHCLQFVYVLIMLGMWFRIVGLRCPALKPGQLVWWSVLSYIPAALISILIVMFFAPGSIESKQAYTALMRYGTALPVLVTAWFGWHCRKRWWVRREPLLQLIVCSALLVTTGFVLGSMIRGDTLLVPAHYHATTGAVNLAFMGVFYLSYYHRLSARGAVWIRRQLLLYSAGVLILSLGLAWSGMQGQMRKVEGVKQGFSSLWESSAMLLMGLGGAVALTGCFMFVFLAARLVRRQLVASAEGCPQVEGVTDVNV